MNVRKSLATALISAIATTGAAAFTASSADATLASNLSTACKGSVAPVAIFRHQAGVGYWVEATLNCNKTYQFKVMIKRNGQVLSSRTREYGRYGAGYTRTGVSNVINRESGYIVPGAYYQGVVTVLDGNGNSLGYMSTGAPQMFVAATTRERIADIAREEIGITEAPAGSNDVKYNGYSGQAWCSSFATWVWRQAGVNIGHLPYSGDMYVWAQNNTTVRGSGATPQVGDAVLFGTSSNNSSHVAIIVGVRSDGKVQTVGGNESDRVNFKDWHTPTGVYGYASPV